MIKLKPKVIKKWIIYGYQNRKAGFRCITECYQCGKKREFTYSIIKKGGGLFCSVKCRSKFQGKKRRMENHPRWKGGKRKDKRGYILIKKKSGNKGYIREHRLVIEKFLGRKLKSWEIIHHKNGIKDDNRIENLQIVIREIHKGKVKCPYCENNFYIQ